MRIVSEGYKQAVIGPEIYTRLEGKLTAGSRIYDITDAIIMPGSLSINRKAINRNSFEYGAVVASEASITLILPNADRYTMYDAGLDLTLYTLLPDGTEEALHLGTWNISECTKTKKYLALKAYDNMLRFDQIIEEDTVGGIFDILKFACDRCGVKLSQTREDIEALPNGKTQIRVRAEEIETYRDLISYIAMITCTFAKINDNGKLILQPFGKDAVRGIITRQVMSSSISDFQTVYSGVKARFIADTNYAPYDIVDNTGFLILDMGDIPIVRGLPENKYDVLKNILSDLKQIRYTPAELSILGDPSIEPGDMLTVHHANLTDDDVVTLVTSTTWNLHGTMKVVSAGSNPRIAAAKDKNTKQLMSMESKMDAKDVIILRYTNARSYNINQTYTEIVDMSFTTLEGCRPIFLCTVPYAVDTDGIVEFALYNGLAPVPHAAYKEYVLPGEHFASIFYPMSGDADERKNIRILARAYKQEGSKIRAMAADLQTLKNMISAIQTTSDLSKLSYDTVQPDDTAPLLTIAEQEIKAVIYAQGIETRTEWNGDLDLMDHMEPIPMISTSNMSFSDPVSAQIADPMRQDVRQHISLTEIRSTGFSLFQATAGVDEVIQNYIIDPANAEAYEYDARFVAIEEGSFRLKQEYIYEGSYKDNIASVAIDCADYAEVMEVKIDE